MKKFKNDLLRIDKDIKALTKKIEVLMNSLNRLEKKSPGKAAKPTKSIKGKTASKSSVDKGSSISVDTENLITIIHAAKDGIDVPALMKKTKFNEKKVRNIVQRAYKSGKIKRVGRGLYSK